MRANQACILMLSVLALFALSCLEEDPNSEDHPTQIPTPTVIVASRCIEAPAALVSQLENGLTAYGSATLHSVFYVENNDNRPWRFIGGKMEAPGADGIVLTWATSSLDLDGSSLIVAVDSLSEEFSVWSISGAGQFAQKFDDEIEAVRECASG